MAHLANFSAPSTASVPLLQRKTASRCGGALLREALHQLLGEQAAHQRGIELHHVGQVQFEDIADRLLDHGVVAANVEDAEAGEEIEVVLPVHVVEVRALSAGVDDVKTDGALDLDQRAIEMAVVELVVLAQARGDEVLDIKRHR